MASASGTLTVPKGSGAVLGLWLSACIDRFTSQGNGTLFSPWPCPALDSRMDSDQIPKGMGADIFPRCGFAWLGHLQPAIFQFCNYCVCFCAPDFRYGDRVSFEM